MYMSKRKYILEQYQPGVVQNNSVILTNIVLEDLLPIKILQGTRYNGFRSS